MAQRQYVQNLIDLPVEEPLPEEMVNPETGVPNFVVNDAGNYGDQLLQMMQSPEQKAKLLELEQRSQQALDQQQMGVEQNQKSLEGLRQQAQLKPLAQLADQWFGGSSASGYVSPEDVIKLQQGLQLQKQGLSKEQIDLLKSQMSQNDFSKLIKNQGMVKRLDQRDKALGFSEDKMAASAAQSITNNPLINKTTQQLGQLQIDRHTIETSDKVTPQILHEISNGIANALAGGRGVGLGMSQMQDLSTLQSKMAQTQQYILNRPEEAASPEIKKQVVDTLNRLEDAYGSYQYKLAQQISKGKNYPHSKVAQKALREAADQFKYTPKYTPHQTSKIPAGKNKMSYEEWIKAGKPKAGQ